MQWLTLCVLSGVLLVYILVGGAIFMALEKENEDEVTTTQSATFKQFLTDNTCVTASELSAFAKAVIEAYDSGVIATNDTSSTSNWEYGPSVFFSVTVVTTIGYGHISPSTSGGRVFFIFYAILGIPLTAVVLGALGEKIAKPYKKLEQKLLFPNHPKSERIGKIIIFTSICFVLFSLIPAWIFSAIEGWTYLEAWYYTVVTLTTVGFGDFVPGESSSNVRGLYKVICAVWLFMGLAWLAMVLNLVGEFIKAQSSKVDGDTKKSKQEEEQNNDTDNKSNDKTELQNVEIS